MNRVDRLVAIALPLQSRRLVRAEDLAAHFEISVRTVYRDLAAPGEKPACPSWQRPASATVWPGVTISLP